MPVAGCEPDGFSCFLAVRIFLSRCNSLLLLVILQRLFGDIWLILRLLYGGAHAAPLILPYNLT